MEEATRDLIRRLEDIACFPSRAPSEDVEEVCDMAVEQIKRYDTAIAEATAALSIDGPPPYVMEALRALAKPIPQVRPSAPPEVMPKLIRPSDAP